MQFKGLGKVLNSLVSSLVKVATEKKLTERDVENVFSGLELELVQNDVAVEVVEALKEELKRRLVGSHVKRGREKQHIVKVLRESLLQLLSTPAVNIEEYIEECKGKNHPATLIFLGFNGVGKSLSLVKLARYLRDKGYKPLIAAGDTFRAAGIEQLVKYAQDVGIPVIKRERGADSCAVIYDARMAAKARGFDVVLADTAGRSHMDKNLVEELRKICRVNRPNLKILVLDGLAGNDVVNQCRVFDEAVGIDAMIVTKMDANPRGGAILSAVYTTKRPVLFVGVGQGYNDLKVFNPKEYVNSLLGTTR